MSVAAGRVGASSTFERSCTAGARSTCGSPVGRFNQENVMNGTAIVRRLCGCALALLGTGTLLAQVQFQRALGTAANEEGHAIAATSDMGYVTASEMNGDIVVTKYDMNGVIQFNKILPAPNSVEQARAIRQTTDGG